MKKDLYIVPDPDLAAGGVDLSTHVVDLKVKGVSIESVLSLILGADLGYKVEAGYILVTTRAKLQQNLPIVTYPVQDLVASIPDFGGMAPPSVTVFNGQAVRVSPGSDRRYGAMTAAGVASTNVRFSDGRLEVPNDAAVVGQVQAVLDRLRANWGQRVAVGSRNVYVAGAKARSAGVQWVEGLNSVRYAVVDEGALLNLMDLEQRDKSAPQAGAARDVYQDAVVGTQALLANGAVVDLARAGDRDNTLDYNGNDIQVVHDDYLLVDNGSYVTAVKAGEMRHWAAEAEPVKFPGVPAAVVVPAVGRTVKFEKTLLEPEDVVELVTEYTWEGESR